MLKKGDKVKIKDGSYMMTIFRNELVHHIPQEVPIGLQRQTFTVIDSGCSVPMKKDCGDTIIIGEDGRIWFCKEDVNLRSLIKTYEWKLGYDSLRLKGEVRAENSDDARDAVYESLSEAFANLICEAEFIDEIELQNDHITIWEQQ